MDSTSRMICELSRRLAHGTNRSVSTISRLASGSGDTVRRLEAGRRITTYRAERTLRRLSEIWDDERVAWPSDVPRPSARNEREAA